MPPLPRLTAASLCAAALFGLAAATPAAADTEPFAYTVVDAAGIPVAIGGVRGDGSRGATLAATHCAACHDAGGSVVASLSTRDTGALRLAIVNLAIALPDLDLPGLPGHAFYHPDADGRTRLDAQAIEDILAHLATAAD